MGEILTVHTPIVVYSEIVPSPYNLSLRSYTGKIKKCKSSLHVYLDLHGYSGVQSKGRDMGIYPKRSWIVWEVYGGQRWVIGTRMGRLGRMGA